MIASMGPLKLSLDNDDLQSLISYNIIIYNYNDDLNFSDRCSAKILLYCKLASSVYIII